MDEEHDSGDRRKHHRGRKHNRNRHHDKQGKFIIKIYIVKNI